MAVAYGSQASAASENSTTLVITKPASLAAGDMMVAFMLARGSATWSAPAGWDAKGTVSISNNKFAAFAKVASAGDASATDFTFSGIGGTSEAAGFIIRLTGTFTDGNNVTGYATASDATADSGDIFVFSTSLTPIASAFLVACCGSEATNASTTTSATVSIATSNPTWTQRSFQGQPNGDDVVVVGLTASRPEATAIGDTTFDFDSTGNLSNGGAIVLAVHETTNVTPTPSVISTAMNIVAPAVSAGASITASVISLVSSIVAPTVTVGSEKWATPNKTNISPTVVNPDKS